jgi:hypothetical protein
MYTTKHVRELDDSMFIDYLKEFVDDFIRRSGISGSYYKNLIKAQGDNAKLLTRAELAEKTVAERDAKIANLHAIITKKTAKIKRQAERITELEALYAGTKRAKKAKVIKAKYRALKAYCEARDVR